MSIEKVKEYFRQYGMEDRVWEKEHSSATVEEAAEALGCVLPGRRSCGAGGDGRRPKD